MLSPAKPVRTRFVVAGEGAYVLSADILPPPRASSAAAPGTPGPAAGASTAAPSAAAAAAKADASAPGPLGLVGATKVGVVEGAVLGGRGASSKEGSVSGGSASGGMFSLRKLGWSFGGGSGSEVDASGGSSVGRSGSQNGVAAPPPVAGASFEEGQSDGQSSWGEGGVSGVLVHNFVDGVVILDLAAHAGFDSSPGADARHNLKVRGTPSAHAIADGGGGVIRLVVGCVGGEVLFWEDVATPSGRGDGRRRQAVVGGGDCSAVTFNRDGVMNSTRVVAVRWIPGPGFRFVAVHVDGAVILYDTRHKKSGGAAGVGVGVGGGGGDGGAAHAQDSAYGSMNGSSANGSAHGEMNGVAGHARNSANGVELSGSTSSAAGVGSVGGFISSLTGITDGATGMGISDRDRDKPVMSEKSSHSTEAGSVSGGAVVGGGHPGHSRTSSLTGQVAGRHDLIVTRSSRGKRINPVSMMQVGAGSVADAQFSPLLKVGEQLFLALACRDGYLRIIDITREMPAVSFRSYFGALLCAAWSPDGKYVATGGEDDLVSIWCPAEERIIARCEGHTSWVSAVAWDKTLCRDGRYRLASAGQDTKLLLWDFSLEMLVTPSSHRSSARAFARVVTGPIVPITGPAAPASTAHAPVAIVSSISGSSNISSAGSSTLASVEKRPGKLARLRGHASGSVGARSYGDDADPATTVAPPGPVVDALNRSEVPIIEPVLTHVAHVEPLTDVYFLESGIITADCVGNVKLWARPPQQLIPPLNLSASNAHLD